jgi:CRISPR-associated exonuclease Cas4
VVFDADLKSETEQTAEQFHALIETGVTPKPVYGKQCDTCSLKDLCLPKTVETGRSIDRYLMNATSEP